MSDLVGPKSLAVTSCGIARVSLSQPWRGGRHGRHGRGRLRPLKPVVKAFDEARGQIWRCRELPPARHNLMAVRSKAAPARSFR